MIRFIHSIRCCDSLFLTNGSFTDSIIDGLTAPQLSRRHPRPSISKTRFLLENHQCLNKTPSRTPARIPRPELVRAMSLAKDKPPVSSRKDQLPQENINSVKKFQKCSIKTQTLHTKYEGLPVPALSVVVLWSFLRLSSGRCLGCPFVAFSVVLLWFSRLSVCRFLGCPLVAFSVVRLSLSR